MGKYIFQYTLVHNRGNTIRGKYYRKSRTAAVINIVDMGDGDIPFDNKDDLVVQYDSDKGVLIMKQMRKVKL